MPVIEPGTPAANAFQDAIQKQLAQLGYSTDDDTVMAEYCVVMLGNSKTKEQISNELAELVGSDFDNSFVDWLFDEMNRYYPDTNSASSSSAAAARQDPSGSNKRRSANANDRPIFGQAVTGVKRGAQDDGPSQPPHQRQRQDGQLPTGPRNAHQDRDRRRSGRDGGERSIFDRVTPRNVRQNGGNNQFNDPIAATIEAVNRGQQPPGVLASIPFPVLMSHPAAKHLNPQALAQAQAAAMAQAQAFAAMSGAFNGRPGGGPPGFGVAPMPGGFPGAGGLPHQGMKPPRPMGPLPSKPQSESLCKAGVECKKPDCRYSHPSPVATKESGLVLSSEACEKQLDCADPDCPKSHVSPAQKTVPPQQRQGNAPPQMHMQMPMQQQGPMPVDPSLIAGAGAKPCKFGANCQRPGCVFVHPWDTQSNVPCRYGENCTRPDCRFAHPGRRGGAGGGMPKYDKSKFSATFNNPSSATTTTGTTTTATTASTSGASKDAIGDKPKEDETHVSERLKRFANAEKKEGGKDAEDDKKVEITIEASSPAKET